MKINELRKPKEIDSLKKDVSYMKKVDSRDQSWMETLPGYLGKHGFRRVGSGKYAMVFVNDKYPFALKIFQKDAAFLRWFKFCKKNQNNPFVPKVKGGLVKITDMIFAIRMEKLNPFHKHKDTNLNKLFLELLKKFENREDIKKTDNKYLNDIFEFFYENEQLMDLHNENMMADDKGQIKITDCFYNWFSSEKGKYTIDPDEIDF